MDEKDLSCASDLKGASGNSDAPGR